MLDPAKPDFSNTPVSSARPDYCYIPVDTAALPQVSIVTAFFNTGEVFNETAQSVLNQSFQQWEWLIVNDGSDTTASIDILAAYRQRDPRIRVIDHETNQGLSAARNTGFKSARAPYVVNLDSDDLLETTAVEKWLWFLETHPQYGFAKGFSVNFGDQEFLWTKGFDEGPSFLLDNPVNAMAMIRKSIFESVNGYDTTFRTGLEDWDFWLRAANAGHWGGMIPEFLDWYRRRLSHSDRWTAWNASGIKRFRKLARARYPRLWKKNGFPKIADDEYQSFPTLNLQLPCENRLSRTKPRALFIVPWMEIGGADKVNLDWISGLISNGYEVSICATLDASHRWASKFSSQTPDVFILPNFLPLRDFPRFLVYLIRSRQIETVFVTNSTIGYQLLPLLRSQCPETLFLDINHMEEPHWLNGGHPRFGVGYQELLDLNLVISQNLRNWMAARGADPTRIEVCYAGVDENLVHHSAEARLAAKRQLGLSPETPCIAFVGRLCQQKRPLLAIEVLHRISQLGLKFQCLMIGDGELRLQVEKLIRHYNLGGRVTITGAVEHSKCIRLFAAADILFLPSENEGISLALYEAMAMGAIPVVAAVGGHREVISQERGFLVEQSPSEIEDYVSALAKLLSNHVGLMAMAENNQRHIAKDFTHAQSVARLLRAISRARAMAQESPRTIPPAGFATELATLAIEYAYISRITIIPPTLARLLAWARRYRAGRLLVNNRIVQCYGKRILKQIRMRSS